MDELKEERQTAAAETGRCGGKTKKERFRRASDAFELGYRVCYLLGMQTLRTGRALERRLTKLLTPAVRAVRRGAARMAARLSGWLQRSGRTLRGEFAQAGRLVREAWQRHPAIGILQALKLPVLAVRRHKKAVVRTLNVAMPAAAVLVLALTVHYWSHLTFALALEYDGQPLGYIRDESVYDDAAAMAAGRVINEGNAFQVECAPRLTLAVVSSSELLDQNALCDKILQSSSEEIERASGLYIDNRFEGAVSSRAGLEALLESVMAPYRSDDATERVEFVQKVEIIDGLYPTVSVVELDQVSAYLGTSVTATADTQSHSPLTVKVTRTITYEETVDYTTETVEDEGQYLGYRAQRNAGEEGIDTITADVTYIGGEEQSRRILSVERTREPVNEVIVVGAMKYDDSVEYGDGKATGRFIWPVPGYHGIYGDYGPRGSGWHDGVDISGSAIHGKPIIAADGGTVIVANATDEWGAGWGYYVLIDHGNGYQTRYAHCSAVNVTVGQKVAQGQLIGLVGNTGDSYGAHCHFEILVNGVSQNPLNFVQ